MLSILQLDVPAEEVRAEATPVAETQAPEPVATVIEDPVVTDEPVQERVGEPVEVPAAEENPEEFEIVLGRAQVASVLFVATVVVVVFSAISYLAGRALSPRAAARPEPATAAAAPVLQATVVKTPDFPLPEPPVENAVPARPVTREIEPPMFATPTANATYLQMGAVEKGVAVIMVDGLRKRGFSSFAAPGPSDTIFRVLIGPLEDAEAFRITKEKVDQIGLNSFLRKYQP